MTADSTALAALLRSHPEECAAVVAALIMHGRDMLTPSEIASELCVYDRGPPVSRDLIVRIGVALGVAHLVKVSVEGVGEIEGVHRMAIARMGAAAWLRARCLPPSPSFDDCEQASRDRLCDIHAMAVHHKHPTARAIRSILIGAASGAPVGRDKYRGLLVRIGAYGVPIDVDAEVAAVWGAQP